MESWTQADIDDANSLAAISAPDERQARYCEFQSLLYRAGKDFQVGENNGRCGVIQYEDHYAVAKLWAVPQSVESTTIYMAHASYTLCCKDCVPPLETMENYYKAFVRSGGFALTIISHNSTLGVSKGTCSETVADNLHNTGARPPSRSVSETLIADTETGNTETFITDTDTETGYTDARPPSRSVSESLIAGTETAPTTIVSRASPRKAKRYLDEVLHPPTTRKYIEAFRRPIIKDKYPTIFLLDGFSSGSTQWDYQRVISISNKYFNILKNSRESPDLDSSVRVDFERSVEVLVHYTYYIAECLLRVEGKLAPRTASHKINDQHIEVYKFLKNLTDITRRQSVNEWAREMRKSAVLVIRLLLKVANVRGLPYVNSIFISMGRLKLSGMREIGKCSEEERDKLGQNAQESAMLVLPDIQEDASLPEFPLHLLSAMLESADKAQAEKASADKAQAEKASADMQAESVQAEGRPRGYQFVIFNIEENRR